MRPFSVKLKCTPEDFQVEELTDFSASGGPYALYRLTKRSIGTPEAIDAVARRWNVPRQRLAYGGLKDKHAITQQFVTLKNGPRRDVLQSHLEMRYLGQAARDFGPTDITGNRFAIVMRDLSDPALQNAIQALEDVRGGGLPNYFDDQRFGSVGASGEFIGRAWCAGDFERALWLVLADPNADDRPDEREQKQILRDHWGKWKECKAALARSNRRSIITYLADKPADRPSDFRGAFARLRVDLRSLYLAAFQSDLWNRLLARWIRSEFPDDQLVSVPLKLTTAPFLRATACAADKFSGFELPLPSARLHLDEGPMHSLISEVLLEQGLELRQLRVKYPRDSFFSKGNRQALIALRRLSFAAEPDELYPRRQKLVLKCDLPRGAYATILVKRLTDAAGH